MSPSIVLLVLIIALASTLMIATRLRPDLVALLTLVALGLGQLVTPRDLFAGFSGSAVITILSIFIISEGLQQTGVTLRLGRWLLKLSGGGEARAVLVTTLAAAILSLFMNNIAAAGVLLPAVVALSRQSRIPPSRLLMPLAFGTILGGMATLLTTANIIVSGVLRDAGLRPFGLLDFLPVGTGIVLAGTLYMVGIGRHRLPARYPAGQAAGAVRLRAELASIYGIQKSLCELQVRRGSALAGLSLRQGEWGQRLGLHVVGVARGSHVQMAPAPEEIIQERDVVFAQGDPNLEKLEQYGLVLFAQPTLPLQITDETTLLGELILSPHARVVGRSLRDLHFREKFGLNVVAIWRRGEPTYAGVADMPLRAGDALLVQGPAARLRYLREERDFLLLEEDPEAVFRPRAARRAAAISVVTLGVAAFGVLPVPLVTLAGASLMFLSGCLSMDEGYRAVDWKAIFLIAGMWPLGTALTTSGLANLLARSLLRLSGALGPLGLAAVLVLVATVLNQLIAGQAAVPILLAPIALAVASGAGTDPRSMAMAVALGSSLAFLTPLGHPVNTLVMGSGGYTYRDFLRVGWPLTLIVFALILIGLALFWGL